MFIAVYAISALLQTEQARNSPRCRRCVRLNTEHLRLYYASQPVVGILQGVHSLLNDFIEPIVFKHTQRPINLTTTFFGGHVGCDGSLVY